MQQEYLTGVRGKGGGYRLSLEPEACSVRQILEAAEGPLVPVVCMSGAQECPRMEECPTLPLWRGLDRVISEYLDSFTLEDLLDHTAGAMQARVPAEGAGS